MEKFWIKRIVRGVAIFFLAIAFFSLLSFIVMNLWNSILVVVLHVGIVSFWQAAGILLLSKILFGFGGGRWRNRGDHKGFCREKADDGKMEQDDTGGKDKI